MPQKTKLDHVKDSVIYTKSMVRVAIKCVAIVSTCLWRDTIPTIPSRCRGRQYGSNTLKR